MLDFSKLLRPQSAAERLEQEKRRRAAAIADDHARRLLRSRRTVVITLSRDPEARFTNSGAGALHFYGVSIDGRPVRAVWYAPDHVAGEEFDEIAARYAVGTKIELRGYWKSFDATSGTSFTFIAQFVTERAEARERKSADAEIAAFG